jgi:hypothetical protein
MLKIFKIRGKIRKIIQLPEVFEDYDDQ